MIFGSYRQGIKFFSSPLMVTTKDLSCADRLPTTNMNCFFKSYLINICHSRRLRESMQLLTLALAQMSAVHLLFSDCFLRGDLSSILSTTLAGWVGACRYHDPQTDDILVHAYTLYLFRPLVPPSLDSELGTHSGNAWSYVGHRSQVPLSAFSSII